MLTAREVAIYALGKTEGVNSLARVVLYRLTAFMKNIVWNPAKKVSLI